MNEILFRDVWWIFAVLAVASYFVGCFNFALLISKIKHKDVRKMGSGNPGTMNMSRQFGLKIGAATLFLDMFKGGAMVLVGYFVFRGKVFAGTDFLVSDLARYVCGVCVIVGHIYPLLYIFKSEWGSMGSLFGVSLLTVAQGLIFYFRYAGELNNPYVIAVFMLLALNCFLTWFAHRKNIVALLAGEEHRTSVRKLSHGKKES